MPAQRPLTVISYAAGASLAAATLIYLFSPTLFLDDRNSGWFPRRSGVVGLTNLANDCFINCVLQALASSGDLRVHLIQEIHHRSNDNQSLYLALVNEREAIGPTEQRRRELLLAALVTQALKDILDRLNERPLSSKTISASPFIRAVEQSYGIRIHRQQQDAQEFFQVVAERLLDESLAVRKARAKAAQHTLYSGDVPAECDTNEVFQAGTNPVEAEARGPSGRIQQQTASASEGGRFPFEGKLESIIECQVCQFQPTPSQSTFVNLTLNVPQRSSTTLDECFDGLMKQEIIDDYRCDLCRLRHALGLKIQALHRSRGLDEMQRLRKEIEVVEHAIKENPEDPPVSANLPQLKYAPRSRIAKHVRIKDHPKTLVIHLSRSIFDRYSTKNDAKVNFGEHITLGGILDRRRYRLIALITHQGAHSSGHYVTFRRQVVDSPWSPPKSLDYARNSSSARMAGAAQSENVDMTSNTTLNSMASSSHPVKADHDASGGVFTVGPGTPSRLKGPSTRQQSKSKRRAGDKWWRMSDESVKECRTSAVLDMQRDAYMLFYEFEGPISK